MGCDIHCYIEYKRNGRATGWTSFGGRINPGRDYLLFTKLAGVRDYDKTGALVEPRGCPEDAGWEATTDNQLFVSTIEGDGNCTPAQAKAWVSCGGCSYTDSTKTCVTHPDWHTHSWLTPGEFAKAIRGTNALEYRAILATMRAFERNGCKARLVFWFDN